MVGSEKVGKPQMENNLTCSVCNNPSSADRPKSYSYPLLGSKMNHWQGDRGGWVAHANWSCHFDWPDCVSSVLCSLVEIVNELHKYTNM